MADSTPVWDTVLETEAGSRRDAGEPDALSRALTESRPELAGRVHYLGGEPWCDGINHTTMCQPEEGAQ